LYVFLETQKRADQRDCGKDGKVQGGRGDFAEQKHVWRGESEQLAVSVNFKITVR
jgi:hypothetical protein